MASTDTPKTILLRGSPAAREGIANAAITPGHLIEQMSTGKLRVHATAGAPHAPRLFAREEEYVGGAIATAYAAEDTLPYWDCKRGDQIYALLAANAAAIVIGDVLESAGDGTLRIAGNYLTDNSGGTANTTLQDIAASPAEAEIANNDADLAAAINRLKPGVIARALEAVDNSAVAAVARIRVEIL